MEKPLIYLKKLAASKFNSLTSKLAPEFLAYDYCVDDDYSDQTILVPAATFRELVLFIDRRSAMTNQLDLFSIKFNRYLKFATLRVRQKTKVFIFCISGCGFRLREIIKKLG